MWNRDIRRETLQGIPRQNQDVRHIALDVSCCGRVHSIEVEMQQLWLWASHFSDHWEQRLNTMSPLTPARVRQIGYRAGLAMRGAGSSRNWQV